MFTQTAFVAVGFALIAAGVWFAWLKPRRLWRVSRGRWVPGRVTGIEPAGHTTSPPYDTWPARVRVRYLVDGTSREGTLWLDRTAPDDYEVGQPLQVFVFGRNGGRLRTAAETNHESNSLRLVPAVLGLVAVALGIVALTQSH